MKNSADLGGCYPPRPSNFGLIRKHPPLLELHNSSHPTHLQSIIDI